MTEFLDGRVTLLEGDCREQIKTLADSSIDSCVCDPPYALVSIAKRFGKEGAADGKSAAPYQRTGRGFMGKQWDNGESAFASEFWTEVYRVLKPGGHVVAFGGTRTYHRLACAIEDAGFEIRDQVGWTYGGGFPKSHNVGKAIDRAAGAKREVVRTIKKTPSAGGDNTNEGWKRPWAEGRTTMEITAPATDAARQWDGWGTALKPAWEPICLARKPLIGTVAENILQHGTGALNIDGCRVGTETVRFEREPGNVSRENWRKGTTVGPKIPTDYGRWPANILHDGSDEVLAAFPDTATGDFSGHRNEPKTRNTFGKFDLRDEAGHHGDSGSAARFFYTAKADADDRLGSKHPTVKPLDLMQYLVRLVTPLGGTVLDPFAGTGTTGEAAWREGMRAILIEREPEYQADIARRMELAANPTKRAAVAASKNNLQGAEGTPLFEGLM